MAFYSGVPAYVSGTIQIPFPEGEAFCWNCPLFWRSRQMCLKSGEIIEDVRSRGRYCEIKFEEGTE